MMVPIGQLVGPHNELIQLPVAKSMYDVLPPLTMEDALPEELR